MQTIKYRGVTNFILFVNFQKHKNVPHLITSVTVQKCGTFAIIRLLWLKSLLEVYRAGFLL